MMVEIVLSAARERCWKVASHGVMASVLVVRTTIRTSFPERTFDYREGQVLAVITLSSPIAGFVWGNRVTCQFS